MPLYVVVSAVLRLRFVKSELAAVPYTGLPASLGVVIQAAGRIAEPLVPREFRKLATTLWTSRHFSLLQDTAHCPHLPIKGAASLNCKEQVAGCPTVTGDSTIFSFPVPCMRYNIILPSIL